MSWAVRTVIRLRHPQRRRNENKGSRPRWEQAPATPSADNGEFRRSVKGGREGEGGDEEDEEEDHKEAEGNAQEGRMLREAQWRETNPLGMWVVCGSYVYGSSYFTVNGPWRSSRARNLTSSINNPPHSTRCIVVAIFCCSLRSFTWIQRAYTIEYAWGVSKTNFWRDINDKIPVHIRRTMVASKCLSTIIMLRRVRRFARRAQDSCRAYLALEDSGELESKSMIEKIRDNRMI